MSESGERKARIEFPKLDALEAAVGRALRQLEVWRERAMASESERRRLQETLDAMEAGDEGIDSGTVAAELKRLREENERLRKRLEEGRHRAEKLSQEIEFLEDTR
jgi:hypothetical protein